MSTPDWFNVKNYGAAGNGSTDDTSAINAAIAALVAAGRGVLYFPAGKYKVTAGLTALSVPFGVMGDGQMLYDHSDYLTEIDFTDTTGILFTVTAKIGWFADLGMYCTGTATAGSAVSVQTAFIGTKVDFESVLVDAFYDQLDIQTGNVWTMHNVIATNSKHYGVKVQNTVNADAGDWNISDSNFGGSSGQAAVHIESSGGGKIVNSKINTGLVNGIELAVAGTTSILIVTGCSIENLSGDGIHGTNTAGKTYADIIVSGCQFGGVSGSAMNLNATAASDFSHISFAGNVSSGANGTNMVTITNCGHVRITNNDATAFTNLLSQTTCTDVVSV